MKKGVRALNLIFLICVISLFSISLVSASWLSDFFSKFINFFGKEGRLYAPACTDSDKGLNYTLKGTISKGNISYTDACVNASSLKEYYCSSAGYISYRDYNCYYGCSSSACISASPINQAGLVTYYKFEENVLDSSGKGNNGKCVLYTRPRTTCPVLATYTLGKIGKALNLTDHLFNVTDSISLNSPTTTGQITIMFWVKFDALSQAWILRKDNAADRYRDYGIKLETNNRISFRMGAPPRGNTTVPVANQSYTAYTNPVNLSTKTWHYVATTFDRSSGAVKIYFDGINSNGTQYVNKDRRERVLVDTTAPLQTGWPFLGLGGLKGFYLDELRIYNRVLSDSEIKAVYEAEK